MKSHSIELKAFSKSRKTAIPRISFILVKSRENDGEVHCVCYQSDTFSNVSTLYIAGLTRMHYAWQDLFQAKSNSFCRNFVVNTK